MAPREKPTAEIVRELKRGRDRDENFQCLFERYYGPLCRFFQAKGIPAENSETLTQETFLSVYRGLIGLRQEDQFEGWLYKIAMNVLRDARDHQRAKKRAGGQVPLDAVGGPAAAEGSGRAPAATPEASPMDAMLEKERREKLHAALEELPAQMCRCVQLSVVSGLTYSEIAGVMGLSPNTVRAHLHQARHLLREKLAPYFSGGVDF